MKNNKINPRSKDLDFWQGVSSWLFADNKNLTISSSNQSSVAFTIQIICPTGKIVINEDMSVSVYKRNELEIKNDPRIIRLGIPERHKNLDYIPNYSTVSEKLISPLLDIEDSNIISGEREIAATKCILYALISSKLNKKILINENVSEKLYKKEWMIS